MLPQTSVMVSHLINSHGLTSEIAESVCRRVKIVNPEKADAFINYLSQHGFTPTQIFKIINTRPQLLLYNAEKIISPKLDFYCSVGLTGPNLIRFISSNPVILSRSLSDQIIPSYNFFKSALLHDDLVIKAYGSSCWVCLANVQQAHAKFSALKAIGVPQSGVTQVLLYHSRLLTFKVEKFNWNVKKAIDMGFTPAKKSFINALVLFNGLKESSWQRKVKENGVGLKLRSCGLSKSNLLCMSLSEEKLMGVMEIFVNKLGLKSSFIIDRPNLLLFSSLDKRIIPRGRVIKTLLLKEIVDKDLNFHYVLAVSKKGFLDRFVVKHQGQVSQLLDIFHGKVCLEEIGFQPEDIRAQLQS